MRFVKENLMGSLLNTERLVIRPLEVMDGPLLLNYVDKNRDWLAPWEPVHPLTYYTLEGQKRVLSQCQEDRKNESGVLMGIFLKEDPDTLVGRVSISGIVRGIWQNGYLGYSIAGQIAGQGYMTEVVERMVLFGFGELGLHRLQASVIPRNASSVRVLEKAGFRYEGRALRYLKINDRWEDHDLYAMTVEELRRKPSWEMEDPQ